MDDDDFREHMNEMMRRQDKFILNGKRPEACGDWMRWARWFETADRHVARTSVSDIDVSTVFLGLNHNFMGRGAPILFETMCFVSRGDTGDSLPFDRYTTWEQAETGHWAAVEICRAILKKSEADASDVVKNLIAHFKITGQKP